MSFDLIKTVGDISQKASVKALEVFGAGVIIAFVLLFGKRGIDMAIYAMTGGLEFILAILAAA